MPRWIPTLLLLGISFLAAGPALAQLDVEMAFDPDHANFGQLVSLFGSVENLGAQSEDVTLSLVLEQSPVTVGPIEATFSLGAGALQSVELPFVAIFPGQLVLTLTATAGGFTDTAVATLDVDGFGPPPSIEILHGYGETFVGLLSSDPISVDGASWSEIKALYR